MNKTETTFDQQERADHRKKLDKAKSDWRKDVRQKGFTKRNYPYKTIAIIN